MQNKYYFTGQSGAMYLADATGLYRKDGEFWQSIVPVVPHKKNFAPIGWICPICDAAVSPKLDVCPEEH